MKAKALFALLEAAEPTDEIYIEVDGWEYPCIGIEINEIEEKISLTAWSEDGDDDEEEEEEEQVYGDVCALPESLPSEEEPSLKEA